ncbi:MAG: hypothetical protein RL227_1672 [Pseudomonadota bacterium]
MIPRPQALARPGPLAARYAEVRAQTEALAAPLSEADCQPQSMADASPVKWHLAHVTWFFETFVLEPHEAGFAPFHPAFRVLFNSYYNAVGAKHPRPQRGLVTRPGLAEVRQYRRAVDARMAALLQRAAHDAALAVQLEPLVALGLHHEQQHQELILTDLKHLLSLNPLEPAYQARWPLAPVVAAAPLAWVAHDGGLVEIGHDAAAGGFAFDNETPRHRAWLRPFEIGSRPVTHGEWAEFLADGGYREARWWLSAGWDWVQQQAIEAPLYWRRDGSPDDWSVFTLHGRVPLDAHTPVVHVSLYEADAYARWRAAADPRCRGARLPTEAEWEHAAAPHAAAGIAAGLFLDSGALHPMPAARAPEPGVPAQLYGEVWQWTSSAYLPYPGYQPWAGAVGEYNGKFMVDQTVLRGGSCASPRSHLRASYRNFFPAGTRWQFAGLRLARDL